MRELQDFDKALSAFKKQDIFVPDQVEVKKMIEYVYESNKLEGNQLNLYETTKVITENLTPANKPLSDYLEAKGNFKAIRFSVMAARNKYPLTEKIVKEINKNVLSSLWGIEDFYTSWKQSGQALGEYKVKKNKIEYQFEGKEGEIIPESIPENVSDRMKQVIDKTNKSDTHLLKKAAYLAYQVFINQPFPDGNKRTARLLVTNLTMKEGLPLIVFNIQKKVTFNSALIETYLRKDQNIMTNFLCKEFTTALYQMIEKDKELKKGKDKGFTFTL
ncbi:MAG: Fic family protein [Bacteroidota bacterium]